MDTTYHSPLNSTRILYDTYHGWYFLVSLFFHSLYYNIVAGFKFFWAKFARSKTQYNVRGGTGFFFWIPHQDPWRWVRFHWRTPPPSRRRWFRRVFRAMIDVSLNGHVTAEITIQNILGLPEALIIHDVSA